MNIEQLKRMALDAGAALVNGSDFHPEYSFDPASLARFVRAVAEECAASTRSGAWRTMPAPASCWDHGYRAGKVDATKAIRNLFSGTENTLYGEQS